MNTEQPATPTQNAQPRPAVAGEADPIVNSILARTRWMQRALAPWTRRWLAQTAEPARASAAPGRRALPFVFTADAVQQTLSRVQAQYESFASRPVSEEAGALPLVGTPAQPAQPAVASTAAAGPYSKPFNSLEDFLAAVEAHKERTDTPPPPTENVKPAAKQTQGPYSKPFNSLEEFLKATEAAKARNYAPPPAEEVAPPTPPREAGPYSHAFTSFEEFAKAVEESRQQWGYTAPQDAQPQPASPPPGKIRPISRVEELPARGSSTLANIPAPAPQPDESFSIPDQLPTTTPAAEVLPPQSNSAVPAASAPTSALARPTVIPPFSPAKARGGPTPRGTPPKASGLQPIQRRAAVSSELPAQVEPLPAVSPTSPMTPRPDTMSTGPESALSPADQLALFVQPQTAESASSLAPVTDEVTPADVPLTTRPPAEPAPTRSARGVPPEQRPAIDHVPADAAHEARAVVTPQATPQPDSAPVAAAPSAKVVAASQPTPRGQPSAISGTPSIQREVEEIAQDEFEPSGAEPSTASDLQRHVTESAPTALPSDQASSERFASSTMDEPADATTALPLVQRHVSESSAAPEVSEAESWPEVTATRSDTPLAQRRTAAAQSAPAQSAPATPAKPSTAIPTHLETSSGPSTLPLVQRQANEPLTSAVAFEAALEDEEALPPTVPELAPTRSTHSVPLAQRELDQASTPAVVQRHASEPQVASEPVTPPVVQRQVSEPQTTALTSETAVDEAAVPSTMPDFTPAQSARSTPLAQRQLDQAKPAPATSPVVQRQAIEPKVAVSASDAALDEEESLPTTAPEVTPTRSTRSMPLAQRQTVEAETVAPEAATEVRDALHPAQIAPPVRSEMPLVQRHVADIRPVEEEPIQRQRGEPSSSTTDVAPLPDQTAINISDRILARLAGHEQMPAAKLPDLPLHQPVIQRANASEAKAPPQLVENEFVSATPPVSASAITPAIQRTPEPVIQRTPAEPSTTSQGTGFIQRVESAPVEPGPEAPEPADLDDLARQVYPIIKHMLAVERERRSFR